MKRILPILVILVFVSCTRTIKYKEVEINRISLNIPEYMQRATDLVAGHPSWSQFENDSLGIFMVIRDTQRAAIPTVNFTMYFDSITKIPLTDTVIKNITIASPICLILDGDSAMKSTMTAIQQQTPIEYRMEAIMTSDCYYFVLIWCSRNNYDHFKFDIEHILESFHDINHRK